MMRALLAAACGLSLLVGACAESADEDVLDAGPDGGADGGGGEGEGAYVPPDEPGPYGVGVVTIELTDAARDGRTLKTELWYPARRMGDEEPATYDLMSGAIRLAALPSAVGAVRGATPDASGAPYPVLLFSHGSEGMRWQNVFQTEWAAAHGYVVLAPDHTGNTVDNLLSGSGTVAGSPDPDTAAHLPLLRPGDMSFVLDEAIRRSDEGDALLGGLVDASRVGILGHSYGGYTALVIAGAQLNLGLVRGYCEANPDQLLCGVLDDVPEVEWLSLADPRVKASVAMAPALTIAYGSEGLSHVAQPVLIEGGSLDEIAPFAVEQQTAYDGLRQPRFLLELEGAGHFTFCDVCALLDLVGRDLVEQLAGDIFDDGCGEENLAPATALPIIRSLTQAFLDRYVAGAPEADAYLTPQYAAGFPAANWSADR